MEDFLSVARKDMNDSLQWQLFKACIEVLALNNPRAALLLKIVDSMSKRNLLSGVDAQMGLTIAMLEIALQ
jgi:hypothetical protein